MPAGYSGTPLAKKLGYKGRTSVERKRMFQHLSGLVSAPQSREEIAVVGQGHTAVGVCLTNAWRRNDPFLAAAAVIFAAGATAAFVLAWWVVRQLTRGDES